jgi:hypothetical protein
LPVLHRSGWEVITTCSPKYFDFVKELGASLVFDYVGFHLLLLNGDVAG